MRGPLPALTLAMAMAMVAAGCAELPDTRPPPAMPDAFRTAPPADASTPATANVEALDWWSAFGDPQLSALLARAEASSPDLEAAVARLAAGADAVTAARAQRWPSLGFFAGPVDPAATQGIKRVDADVSAPLFALGLRAQYEIDLWGRVANGVRAADASYAAGRDDLAAARLALRSAVANAYFDLRALDARIALDAAGAPLAQKRVDLVELQARAGRADADTLAAARAAVVAAHQQTAALQRARDDASDALAVLVGVVPQTFTLPMSPLDGVALPPSPPAGLPATLLERRPDLRAAEARLAAAEAQAAVARAERLPQVGLTAEFGLVSGGLSDLLDGTRGFAGIGPSVDAPIFDGGRRSAQAASAKHLADAAAADYRKAALTALAEVERALRARAAAIDALGRADASLQAIDARHRHTELRLAAGRATRFELLDLDTQRVEAQTARLAALRGQQDAAIALYGALGGGWKE